jgi:hypothetical protein
MRRGYVKLWRKSEDSGLMKDRKAWAVWTWLLIHASHKRHTQVVGRISVELNPGQLVIGRKSLSDALDLTEQNVRSCLKLLKNMENITIKSTNKFSILTIEKWELYQSDSEEVTSKITSRSTDDQPATNQQPTTNKNGKNEKNEKKNKILCPKPPVIGPDAQGFYLTKKGKRLEGKRLETFNQLWEAYGYKKGKPAAADAWLQAKGLTDKVFVTILAAAKAYSAEIPAILERNSTPKMLQGWITDRRWEDETTAGQTSGTSKIIDWSGSCMEGHAQ